MDIEIIGGDESLIQAEGIRPDDVIISVKVRRIANALTIKPDIPVDVNQYVKGSTRSYDLEGAQEAMEAGVTECIISMVVSKLNVTKIRAKIAQYSNVVEVTAANEAIFKQYFSRYDETKKSAEDSRTPEEV